MQPIPDTTTGFTIHFLQQYGTDFGIQHAAADICMESDGLQDRLSAIVEQQPNAAELCRDVSVVVAGMYLDSSLSGLI